jgi:hypothetical protein
MWYACGQWYVLEMQSGRRQGDINVGRYLADTCAAVPYIRKEDFEQLLQDNTQDALLVMYLANLVRAHVVVVSPPFYATAMSTSPVCQYGHCRSACHCCSFTSDPIEITPFVHTALVPGSRQLLHLQALAASGLFTKAAKLATLCQEQSMN